MQLNREGARGPGVRRIEQLAAKIKRVWGMQREFGKIAAEREAGRKKPDNPIDSDSRQPLSRIDLIGKS